MEKYCSLDIRACEEKINDLTVQIYEINEHLYELKNKKVIVQQSLESVFIFAFGKKKRNCVRKTFSSLRLTNLADPAYPNQCYFLQPSM